MKKILSIIALVYLMSVNLYAEILLFSKTVNDYVKDDYTIVSVDTIDRDNLAYTLRSNAKTEPLIVTCIYSPAKQRTVCVKP